MSSNSSATELEALKGLGAAKRFILELHRKKSPVHAVLFYGSEGAGKRSMSRILAKSWLCLNPGEAGACGECRACQAFLRGNAVDQLWIDPKPPSNIIRLEFIVPKEPDVISISEFLRTPPLMARSKVVTITSVHRMNRDAANALLKMLEEPPEFARFILTTDTISQIPATIRSRCHLIQCELPKPETFTDANPGILKALGDSPGAARKLEEQADWYGEIAQFASTLESRPTGEAVKAADEFRAICERRDKSESSVRLAVCEGLKVLASIAPKKEWTPAIVEAHRRVQGNGSASTVLEALFSKFVA